MLKEDRYLLKILLVAFKKAIRRKWYKLDPPSHDNMWKTVSQIQVMEKLTHQISTEEE